MSHYLHAFLKWGKIHVLFSICIWLGVCCEICDNSTIQIVRLNITPTPNIIHYGRNNRIMWFYRYCSYILCGQAANKLEDAVKKLMFIGNYAMHQQVDMLSGHDKIYPLLLQ